jgi:hypothetical protein
MTIEYGLKQFGYTNFGEMKYVSSVFVTDALRMGVTSAGKVNDLLKNTVRLLYRRSSIPSFLSKSFTLPALVTPSAGLVLQCRPPADLRAVQRHVR